MLVSLDLSSNNISDHGTKAIVDALMAYDNSLVTLKLRDNKITDLGLGVIANLLAHEKTKIETLDLSYNPIKGEGERMDRLINALQKNSTLVCLQLDHTDIPPEYGPALLKVVRTSGSLRKLDLKGTKVSDKSLASISASAQKHSKWRNQFYNAIKRAREVTQKWADSYKLSSKSLSTEIKIQKSDDILVQLSQLNDFVKEQLTCLRKIQAVGVKTLRKTMVEELQWMEKMETEREKKEMLEMQKIQTEREELLGQITFLRRAIENSKLKAILDKKEMNQMHWKLVSQERLRVVTENILTRNGQLREKYLHEQSMELQNKLNALQQQLFDAAVKKRMGRQMRINKLVGEDNGETIDDSSEEETENEEKNIDLGVLREVIVTLKNEVLKLSREKELQERKDWEELIIENDRLQKQMEDFKQGTVSIEAYNEMKEQLATFKEQQNMEDLIKIRNLEVDNQAKERKLLEVFEKLEELESQNLIYQAEIEYVKKSENKKKELEELNEDAIATLETYYEKIKEVEKENHELRVKLGTRKNKINSLKETVDKMKENENKLREKNRQLEATINEQNRQKERDKMKEAALLYNQQVAELESLEHKYNALKELMDKKDEIDLHSHARAGFDELKAKLTQKKEQISALKKKIEEKDAEKEETRLTYEGKLEALRVSSTEEKEKIRQELAEKIDALQKELDEQKLRERAGEMKTQKKFMEDQESLRSELQAKMDSRCQLLMKQKEELRRELEDKLENYRLKLESLTSDCNSKIIEISVMKKDLEEKERKLGDVEEKLEESLEKLRLLEVDNISNSSTLEAKVRELEQDLEIQKEKMTTKEETNEELKEQIKKKETTIQNQKEEQLEKERLIERLETQMRLQAKDLLDKKNELLQLSSSYHDQGIQVVQLKKDLEQEVKEKQVELDNNQQLSSSLRKANHEIILLTEKLNNREGELAEAQAALQQKETELDKLISSFKDKLSNTENDLLLSLQSKEKEANGLQKQVSDKETEIHSLKEQITELQGKLERKRTKIAKLEADFEQLAEKANKKEEETKQMENQLKQQQQKTANVEQENKDANNQLFGLNEKLKSKENEIARCLNLIKEKDKLAAKSSLIFEEKQKQVESLKEEKEALEKEKNRLRNELSEERRQSKRNVDEIEKKVTEKFIEREKKLQSLQSECDLKTNQILQLKLQLSELSPSLDDEENEVGADVEKALRMALLEENQKLKEKINKYQDDISVLLEKTKSDVVAEGWLHKRGGIVKSWKHRYFTLLTNGELKYYDRIAPKPKGHLQADKIW
eukprot:CAMPEP_0174265476 /NCGR_PEP_ID=MMETSP0439-20130205/26645_1 /TAXON_ID=0 /ORGANISM="Stereomyxa ramosa, Strain Chinc5" /LENGTH=1287 /DNA_ID=CAMNT_0015351947 /DNA_START=244 /DNA_END=4104 /DNA_ORIENTATION=+